MQKAIGYVRVSTDDQAASGLSLDHQRARIEAYAIANDLLLVAIVLDPGVSAGKPLSRRPGGQQLLATLARREAGHVIALKLDRLFRNAADALTQATAWDRSGIGLHLIDVHGATVSTRSAMGRMFFTLMAGFAELERGLIAERTAAAMRVKRQRGEVYSRPMFGYDPEGGRLVPNPAEQAVLERIRKWRRAGEPLQAIADRLNAERVPTKRGGRWHGSAIRGLLQA